MDLLSERSFSKNRFSSSKIPWHTIGHYSSFAQIVFGFLLFFSSTLYLTHTGRSSGQFVGIFTIVLGLISVIERRQKGSPLQLLFITGMAFSALMTFEFTVQMGRDIEIHCTLAESYNRIIHLETRMTSMKHDEITNQLFLRMNEMDDLLDMVQSNTIEKLDGEWRSHSLLQQDAEFVNAKIQGLKIHAEAVLDQILRASLDLNQTTRNPELTIKQKMIQSALMRRIEKVEEMLDVLEKKEKGFEELNYEEFEALFHTLVGVHSNPEHMENDRDELFLLKGAMHRLKNQEHHKGVDNTKNKALDKHREDQRIRFESTFHKAFGEHRRVGADEFDHSLAAAMEDLPEHCLLEMDRYNYFLFGGWILIASQIATAYITAMSLFSQNTKTKFLV